MNRTWRISEADGEVASGLAGELSCSPLLARLLVQRGLRDPGAAVRFLSPKLIHLDDPLELPGMDAAVERILAAIQRRESVVVFGDYDVDGVSAAAILAVFFRQIGFPVAWRLPNRLGDGYGLRPESVEELAAAGTDLIITVDNGISAVDAVRKANALGVDVVVTDHHQIPEELPEAAAVVNPWLSDSPRVFKDLSGSGVAFKLIWALCQRFSRSKKLSPELRSFLLETLAYAALGTISDVVPLVGENRILAKFGLIALRETQQPGLRRLCELAFRDQRVGDLTAAHVAYRIGPRINAAGRMGRAEVALELLLTDDDDEAASLAATLDAENDRRREIEREITAEAEALVREQIDLSRERVIVLGAAGWHVGVIGIVAARITERFFRPTVVVALEGDRGRGSARSIPGVDIGAALARCGDHIIRGGGHAAAAGLEMMAESLPQLRRALNEAIPLDPAEMVPEVSVDERVRLDELTLSSLDELAQLEPFGHANPEPLFLAEGVRVVGRPRTMGKSGQHVAFHVRQSGAVLRAVAFDQADRASELDGHGLLSLLLAPQVNEWQGRKAVELHVQEIRSSN